MSEVLRPEGFYNYSPSNHERASVFIGDVMSAYDRENAAYMAEGFMRPDKLMAETAVLIPVAAHQDADLIIPALEQYALQRNAQPFTIFLHLNAPLNTATMASVKRAEANAQTAQELFPHLDVRTTATTMYESATIGEIRKDLWSAAFLLAFHEQRLSNDVIGINNDIDTDKISPHYISRIQQYYQRRQQQARKLGTEPGVLKPIATRVTHSVLPTHPNVGKVTTWVDNTYFQAPDHVSYEAGLVVPFSSYAHLGGFNQDAKTHETAWVTNGKPLPYLTGAHLYTSPRRYIDRLQQHDTSKIWTEDSFGANDTCRELLPEDITEDRVNDILLGRLDEDIEHHWLSGVMMPIYVEMSRRYSLGRYDETFLSVTIDVATTMVDEQLAKADRLLRKVVRSDILADIIQSSYNAKSYATNGVTGMHDFNKIYDESLSKIAIKLI